MFCTIINDCKDANAMGRQSTRAAQILDCPINIVGVDSDLEAAGNLIDMLDASEGKKGVILVNVAPRHKEAKKWENGTPFAYFHYKETLVVGSIDGLTLSLIKKLGVVDYVNLMDIPTVLESLKKQQVIGEGEYQHIKNTQFRSFEFVPRVAGWIMEGLDIPAEKYSLEKVKDAPDAIWWVDNFGNCKTTLLIDDVFKNPHLTSPLPLPVIPAKAGIHLNKNPHLTSPLVRERDLNGQTFEFACHSGDPLSGGDARIDSGHFIDSDNNVARMTNKLCLKFYNRLKDVPDDEAAIIIGSSGLGEKRFLEIVVQGVSAQDKLKIKSGDNINF